MDTPTNPALGGPDKYHVYIDYYKHDEERFLELKEIFEEEGLSVYTNSTNEPESTALEEGVESSRKVLILVTYSSVFVSHGLLSRADIVKKKKAHRGPRSFVILLYAGICPSNLPEHLEDHTYTQIAQSPDNSHISRLLDAIREESLPPLNKIPSELKSIGFTLASAFFYDYLKNVLPELPDKVLDTKMLITEEQLNERRFSAIPYVAGRRSSGGSLHGVFPIHESQDAKTKQESEGIFTSRRMHVIMPESYLSVLPNSCKPFAYVICSPEEDKAEARQYKAIVYEIQDKRDKKHYRAALSFAPGLKTIADMCQDPLLDMNINDYHRETRQFYLYLRALLNASKYRKLKDTCSLIYLEDKALAKPVDEAIIDCVQAELAERKHEEEEE